MNAVKFDCVEMRVRRIDLYEHKECTCSDVDIYIDASLLSVTLLGLKVEIS